MILVLLIGVTLGALIAGCSKLIPTAPIIETQSVTTIGDEPTPTIPAQGAGDTIAKIQGAGHISPYRSKIVNDVEGVVTVLLSDGFYMQSTFPDGDPATSEGLFVYTERVPRVRVGDAVLVSGRVDEMTPGGGYGNLSRTQIINPDIEILNSNNDLPEPRIIGEGGCIPPTEIIDDDTGGFISANSFFDPEQDGLDFYESFEGMLVQINDAVVVGPTNPFKEIVVLGDRGAFASVRSPRGGIVVQEDDFNPERIILDDLLVDLPFVHVGDYAAAPIIGVMDYDYGNYKFLPIKTPSFTPGGLSPSSPLAAAVNGQLRVASYNVENLSALQPQRMAILAEHIVNLMTSPDIVGLQEIMDNDGNEGDAAISADQTYQGIIDQILVLGGPRYGYVDIDPIPGSDGGIPLGNIRVGYLYRLDSGLSMAQAPYGDAKTPVQVIDASGTPTLSLNPGRIEPSDPAFYSSRKSLAVTFMYQGAPLFMINNHLVSKGEDRSLFGEFQPPILDSEIQRIKQAQVVHDFVDQILEIDPDSWVIVLGDFNDFHFSPPMAILKGEILINLIETLAIPERYTYIHDGNSQVLDHILVSHGLVDSVVTFDILHINAEFSNNTRFSDHEILVATFEFE